MGSRKCRVSQLVEQAFYFDTFLQLVLIFSLSFFPCSALSSPNKRDLRLLSIGYLNLQSFKAYL